MKESLFREDGSIDMSRAGFIAYAHGEYYPLREEPQGFFGYSVAGEKALKRRLRRR